MRPGKASLVIPVLLTLLPALALGVQPDRITTPVDSGQRVTLAGNHHPKAKPRFDQGAVEPSFRLDYVTLLTVPTVSQQKALDRLLAQQQDPSSPNYHKWLTPEQYAERFGLSQRDTQRIATWLKSQGFKIERVARARNWIAFSGNAIQIHNAFQTEIHRYNVEGETHFANATAPTIPASLQGVVIGFRGLHDFRPKPTGTLRNNQARPYYNSSRFGDLVAPGDVATIYDLNPLYAAGIDGTGQKVAVAGQTDVYLADLADFRTAFGLSPINCTTNTAGVITSCNTANFAYVLGGPAPGVSAGDLAESDLDLEWSGATAPNAQVIFVTSNNAFTSYFFAIDNNLAPVISLSYGLCELQNEGFMPGDEAELKKGNSFGITIVNSTGDTGVAACDSNGSTIATGGLGLNYPASSPEVTAVGGTAISLADLSSAFWGTTNGPDGGTALSYVPEISWNDDDEISQFCIANPSNTFCSNGNGTGVPITSPATAQHAIGISSTGGGASNCFTTNGKGVCTGGFPRPSWQTVSISGQASVRFSPDVSVMASPNFPGYIFCTQLSELGDSGTGGTCSPGGATGITNALNLTNPSVIGGTSVSAPVFAGIVALLNQYEGSNPGLGNVNSTLYTLAKTPSNNFFHPVTTGNNVVFCTPHTPAAQPAALQCPAGGSFGYQASNSDAATGYNLVTGLGSIDTSNLAAAWNPSLQDFILATPNPLSASAGQSGQTTITATPRNGFSGAVTFICPSQLPTGATCSISPVSATSATLTIKTQANMAAVNDTPIIVRGTSGPFTRGTTVSFTVTPTTESFALTSSSATLSVQPGQSTGNTVNLKVSDPGSTGFIANNQTALPLTYSCTVSPSASEGPTCAFSPGSPTSVTNPTVSILTTAPVAKLTPPPLQPGTRILYAIFLPGALGLACAAGSRPRAVRMLGLIVVLGLSTVWLGACGGGNNSQKNPGTPPGNYTVTVNATTGGASPLTGSAKFTVTVQ